jgi:predicted phosphodiesterase
MSDNTYRPRLHAQVAPLIEQIKQLPIEKQKALLENAISSRIETSNPDLDSLFANPLFSELFASLKKTTAAPKEEESLPKPYLNGNPDNILVIGDTHFPFCKSGYLSFVREQQERFDCGRVVHIGDECDSAAMSFHLSDPDGHGAGHEADLAQEELNRWYKVFPKVDVLIGNHSALHFRKAFASGVPKRFISDYKQSWNAPEGWNWHLEFELYGVYFVHGTGSSGDNAAFTKALNRRQSVCQGHIHTSANVKYNVSPIDIIWAMQVGCGIDDKAYAFNYAQTNIKKSVISCGVILDKGRIPLVISMPL